jgi:predicted nucleic acid-binding protein
MTVVSNTSPLNYLVLIELQHVLPALFGRVLVPGAVLRELSSPGAPRRISDWLSTCPDYLEVQEVSEVPSELLPLGVGEREAIALAHSSDAGAVLLDERKARTVARTRGLAVSGTLGVLDAAAERQLVIMDDALNRLQRTTFRAPTPLIRLLREKYPSR